MMASPADMLQRMPPYLPVGGVRPLLPPFPAAAVQFGDIGLPLT